MVEDLRLLLPEFAGRQGQPTDTILDSRFARAARFRRLAQDYERLAKTLAALHYLTFAILMLANLARQLSQS